MSLTNNKSIRLFKLTCLIKYALTVLFTLVLLPGLMTGCKSEESVEAQTITYITHTPLNQAEIEKMTASKETVENEPDTDGVELLSIGIDKDVPFIVMSFKVPPKIADGWWQGSLYVIDEKTGLLYDQIPVAPIIGPLIGKPRGEGQSGYVMLSNYDMGIKFGSVVTAVLGKYKRLHVKVQ